jgi:hypothetical protein
MDKTKEMITLKHEWKYCRPFKRENITILSLNNRLRKNVFTYIG